MTDPDLEDGRLVSGRYRVRRLLGRGGMGVVWAAHDEVLRRGVAVKEVVPSPDLTPEKREEIRLRTMREARAAARLTHPSVVTVYDVIEDEGRLWIVMELLPSRTLADVIAEDGPLPPAEATRVGRDLADGLRTAHRAGVLHRDVKPANVILTDTGRSVLTDFGIATVEDDPSLTATGLVVGSPGYLSPERARGERPTPASDLWALGATLFAAVEGDPPFRRDGQLQTLHAVVTEPPPPAPAAGRLRPLIADLLDRDPVRRPTADEAFDRLTRLLDDLPDDLPDDRPAAFPGGAAVAPTAAVPAAGVPTAGAPPAAAPAAGAAPAAAPAAGAPPAEPDGAPTTRPTNPVRSSRRNVVAAAAVAGIAVTAASTAGLLALRSDPAGAGAPGTAAGPTASATAPATGGPASPGTVPATSRATSGAAAPATSRATSPSTAPAMTSGTTPAASGDAASGVPAGFQVHRDGTGFAVAVPIGWTPSVRDGSTFFRDPRGRSFLQVAQTTSPKADALADWQAQEASAGERFPGYRRVRLERVDYRGWNAADWEFVWQPSGGPLHVVNRNVRVNDGLAYALYWSAPDGEWPQRQAQFRTITESFRPASE